MPWHVAKSEQCPDDMPWAVIKDADGEKVGCHASEDDAKKHLAALYASENNSLRAGEERRYSNALHIADDRRTGGSIRIFGHAAVFNQKSEILWGFREIVKPGAFSETIKTADVRALLNHDPNYVLGRTKNGTLKLSEDEVGLYVVIEPPKTSFGEDVLASIRRGDIDQMSFGFRTITDAWRVLDGEDIRELHKVDLFDVSAVTYPAYPQTDVSVRSRFPTQISQLKQKRMNTRDARDRLIERLAAFK